MSGKDDTVALLAKRLLDMGVTEISAREKRVLERMARRLAVSRDVSQEFNERLTFGQRMADRIAEIGGSWGFIIGFALFIAVWTALNAVILASGRSFDPYPFVFLNLILSMLAALQAPVIMMSQNRQAAKDRIAAEHDYEVNLKAEIEIAALHEKLDAIRAHELSLLIQRTEGVS